MSLGSISPVTAVLLADTKEFSASMDAAGAKMEAFGATTATTGERVASIWNKMSTLILGAGVAVAAVSVDLAYKYNEALDTMQRSTNLTAAQMDYLKGQILNVSTATATSATLITTGVTQLIKAGEGEKQALTDVGQAAKYAQATGGNLNDTLTAAIGIQKQHIAGTHSISQSLDIMNTAIKNSQLTADNLNSALGGRALSAFAAFHVDLRSATTLLAGFADQNLNGTRATMALKTGIAALEAPTASSTGKLTAHALILKSVGLNMDTLAGEIRRPGGVLTVLTQLQNAFNATTNTAIKSKGIGAFITSILGSSAGPAFTNLINELPKLESLYSKMNTSTGSVNGSFAQFLHSPAGAVAQFKTALENAAIRIGDVILPKLTVGVIDATRLITAISGNPVASSALVDGALALGGGAIATKLVSAILKTAGGLGLGGGALAAEGEVGVAAISAATGGIAAAGIAAFLGTTEVLKHNLFGLGTAVDKVTGMLGIGGGQSGTVQYGADLAKALAKYGITNNATVSLSPATIDYIEGKKYPGSKSKGRVTINHKTTVKVG